MQPRSVTDLLREQPEEVLVSMRESLLAEVMRVQAELRQVEEALSRKGRRGGGKRLGRPPVRGDVTSITRQQLLAFVRELDRPVTPAEVIRAYADRGVTVSPNSIRNSLHRLLELDHLLTRLDDGRYAPAGVVNENGNRAPLFRDADSQSQDRQARLES